MITAEELYQAYSSNPISWMKKHNCTTSKQITLKLMGQYGMSLMLERNLNDQLKDEMESEKETQFESAFEEWHHRTYGCTFGEPSNPYEETVYDSRMREFKKYCHALNQEWI